MTVERPPCPALRPFVSRLWASEPAASQKPGPPSREHMLPTGAMHLVFRMNEVPLRMLEPAAAGCSETPRVTTAAPTMIGGVRSRYLVRELGGPSTSVGAMLRPGAAELLFGAGAEEFAGRHHSLEDVWGRDAALARERMLEADSAEARLAILETALLSRLPRVRGLHPAIARVLAGPVAAPGVAAMVAASGLSHRHFVAQFRRAVGVGPKSFLRLRRFQKTLALLRRPGAGSLASIAAEAGFSDQSHLQREMQELAGVTPRIYLQRSAPAANHLPMGTGNSGTGTEIP